MKLYRNILRSTNWNVTLQQYRIYMSKCIMKNINFYDFSLQSGSIKIPNTL